MNPGELSESDKFRMQLLLEEYRALRGEIIQSMQNRNSVLTFGSATLGAIISATALSAKSLNEVAIFLIFTTAIPLVSLCTLNFWIAETSRIVRAGLYIREHIEAQINEQFGETLVWETYIRVPSGRKCPLKFEQREIPVDDVQQVFYLFSGITLISFLGALIYINFNSSIAANIKYFFGLIGIGLGLISYLLFRQTLIAKAKPLIKHLRPS
jgi:hypothetical protein